MRNLILACAAAFSCQLALAADIKISEPWVKGTLESQRNSTAYMELFSEEGGAIIAASSPMAQSVDLREMRFELDGRPMRPASVNEIVFQPRKKLLLTPVTEHFALLGLKQAIQAGDKIPLTLKLRMKNGEERTLKVDAIVRGIR